MKIAVNKCFGGFGVSEAVFAELGMEWDGYGYLENKDFGIESDNWLEYRSHPKLIAAIEKVGEKAASGQLADASAPLVRASRSRARGFITCAGL